MNNSSQKYHFMKNSDNICEQDFVIQKFNTNFGYFNSPIILYGVGRNTEAILNNCPINCNIIGLMDVESTGKNIYGKPVLSVDEAIKKTKTVIIVARDCVVNIIYNRISILSENYGVNIYNIHGELLNNKNTQYNNHNFEYWSVSERDLIREINNHDIISFDVFDTLITRKTFQPEDVFALVENELKIHHDISLDFGRLRKKAELSLPLALSTIDDIYDELTTTAGLDKGTRDLIQKLEFEIEKRCLVKREKIVEIFEWSKAHNKTLILTTDTYYPTHKIHELLDNLNITGFSEILCSSALKKSKKDGTLFKHLKTIFPSQKILHIGDNRIDDIEQAHKCGIQTFHILSGYEVLTASSMQSILADIEQISERLYLGIFVAHAFNNPFALNASKGIVSIKNLFDLGYLFIGPLIIEFTKWLCLRLDVNKIGKILFPSRDGFLIEKIYSQLRRDSDSLPESVYFKTSRRILSITAIHDVEDILHFLKKPFKGTKRELLETRYGITPDSVDKANPERIDAYSDPESTKSYVLKYKDKILANATNERQKYIEYLAKKGIDTNERYALFDFVSSGTIPFFLKRLLDADIYNFFFAAMNLPNELYGEISNISAAYGNINSYSKTNNLGLHYLFLESILVDPDATLVRFDEDLEPVFESPDNEKWQEIRCIHTAVKKLLSELQVLCNTEYLRYGNPSMDFSDQLLGYLFGKEVNVDESIKEVFYNDDKYSGASSYNAWI